MPPADDSLKGHIDGVASSHLANVSDAAPATASLPFRPLPMAADHLVRFPAWGLGFLFVFYRNCYNNYAFLLRQMHGTERQMTDRSIV